MVLIGHEANLAHDLREKDLARKVARQPRRAFHPRCGESSANARTSVSVQSSRRMSAAALARRRRSPPIITRFGVLPNPIKAASPEGRQAAPHPFGTGSDRAAFWWCPGRHSLVAISERICGYSLTPAARVPGGSRLLAMGKRGGAQTLLAGGSGCASRAWGGGGKPHHREPHRLLLTYGRKYS
jgi:hypothetical protein